MDLDSEELRKDGLKLKLNGLPFRVLAEIAKCSGRVVTYDELEAKFWPTDKIEDYRHSLGNSMLAIRKVLGDSATSPRYVETVSRGYRILVPVEFISKPLTNGKGPAVAQTEDSFLLEIQQLRRDFLVTNSYLGLKLLSHRATALLAQDNYPAHPNRSEVYMLREQIEEAKRQLEPLGSLLPKHKAMSRKISRRTPRPWLLLVLVCVVGSTLYFGSRSLYKTVPVNIKQVDAKETIPPLEQLVNRPKLQYFSEDGSVLHAMQVLPAYEKEAAAGNVAAMLHLGEIYSGELRDYKKARRWFEKAARAGNADAMYTLGYMYAQGQGVPRDDGKAIRWFTKGADAGNSNAMNYLGFLGVMQVTLNGPMALKIDPSMPGAGNPVEGLGTWYERAAAAGNPTAMYNLGILTDLRISSPHPVAPSKKEMQELLALMVQWYQKAAAGGEPHAMYKLGYLYEHGQGVQRDYLEAQRWYAKAAAADVTGAMNNLGAMYEKGRGIPQDYEQARHWYEQGAWSGNATASYNLGRMYESGLGVARDYAQARQWYEKAAAAGDVDAQQRFQLTNNHTDPKK